MTAPTFGELDRARPLVAVMCVVPLIGEALVSALDFAEVRSFNGGGDIAGLLQWLRPDAIVVDDDEGVAGASAYAAEHALPLVHVCVRTRSTRIFADGVWRDVPGDDGPSPDMIRNVIAGALFARRRETVQ